MGKKATKKGEGKYNTKKRRKRGNMTEKDSGDKTGEGTSHGGRHKIRKKKNANKTSQ